MKLYFIEMRLCRSSWLLTVAGLVCWWKSPSHISAVDVMRLDAVAGWSRTVQTHSPLADRSSAPPETLEPKPLQLLFSPLLPVPHCVYVCTCSGRGVCVCCFCASPRHLSPSSSHTATLLPPPPSRASTNSWMTAACYFHRQRWPSVLCRDVETQDPFYCDSHIKPLTHTRLTHYIRSRLTSKESHNNFM